MTNRTEKECRDCRDGLYAAMGKKVSTRIVLWTLGIILPLLVAVASVVFVTHTGQQVNASTIETHEKERQRDEAKQQAAQDKRWASQEQWQGDVLKKLDTIAERTWTHTHDPK